MNVSNSAKSKNRVYSRFSSKGKNHLKLSVKRKKRRAPQNLLDYLKRRRLTSDDPCCTSDGISSPAPNLCVPELTQEECTRNWQEDNSTNKETNEEPPYSAPEEICLQTEEIGQQNLQENIAKYLVPGPSLNINDVGTTSTQKCPYSFKGRRIVDIGFLFQQLKDLDEHIPFHCSLKNMIPISEKREGLNSGIVLKCQMCDLKSTVWTNIKRSSTYMDVNTAAVSASISTGGGQSQLEEMLTTMDIPCMAPNTFKKYHDNLEEHWAQAAQAEMKTAVKKEIEEAKKRGHIGHDGIPLLTVVADGAWGKRSYRNNYSSHSGVAALMGFYTRKVIFIGVKNKFCTICTRAESRKTPPRDHTCSKNWNQSSSSMEAAIIVEGFLSSEAIYGVRYAKLVADGDSSVYKRILDAKPYKNITVEKIECRNHLLRNYCNKLKDVVKISDGGRYPVRLRKVVGDSIMRLRAAVTKAVQYRKSEDLQWNEKVDQLRKDILNGPRHVFGEHTLCKERNYFCTSENKPNEINLVPELNKYGLMEKIEVAARYLSRNTSSLLQDVDSNAVEQYNSIVSKFVGGKRINFSLSNSYKVRCTAAIVQHNTGVAHYALHKSILGRSPGIFCKTAQLKRKRKVETAKKRRETNPKVSRSLFTKIKIKGTNDQDYGSNAQRPDMSAEDYEKEKLEFLKSLEKTNEERKSLERLTVMQRHSGEWIEQRRKLLTASHFGTVCKRKSTTGCENLVKTIIYSNNVLVPAMQYGQVHEQDAIRDLERNQNIKITECGLFIDKDIPFIGATPDGIVGNDTIVEVKCPSSIADMKPEEAIAANKLQCIIKSEKGFEVNKKSNYYYQVQGQLHITGTRYCLFTIWTKKGILVVRVERDDAFWSNVMENKLKTFYLNCLLPELIDPRHTRSMPIRNPDYILKAQTDRKMALQKRC